MATLRKGNIIWTVNPYSDKAFDTTSFFAPVAYGRTATGYGKKLPTDHLVEYEGKIRRIYYTCYSNCASYFIMFKGEKITVTC